jgi:transposase
MTATARASNNYDTFVGIDVDMKKFAFTVIDKEISNRTKSMPSNPKTLYNYIHKHFPDRKILFGYEAGPTGYHLYDYLASKKCDCLVVSPNTIPKAANENVKNNNIDSRKISENLSAGQLKSIRVPVGEYRELRNLVKMRENYADARKIAKQRIKSLLLHANLYPSITADGTHWSNHFINNIKSLSCSPAVRARLDMLLMDLDYARTQLLQSHRQLRKFVQMNPGIQRNFEYAISVPGIGFITAVTFFAISGNPANLANPREIAGFVGLAPTEHSTGDTENRGPISHLGDHSLRKLFIEAAWVAIRHDATLKQFFHRIAARHHRRGASQKAIVAVARKLSERLYRVLKDQRKYVAF